MKRDRQWQYDTGKWLSKFLNDDLKAAFLRYEKTGLLRAAELAGIDFQGDAHDDSFLPPLFLMKGNAQVWDQKQVQDCIKPATPEEAELTVSMLLNLDVVRTDIVLVLTHLGQNIDNNEKILLKGLDEVLPLTQLLKLRSKSVVQTGFSTKGDSFQLQYQLKLDKVGGFPDMHRWEGLVAHLFIEFLQSDGWRRLRACKICGKYDMKKRADWQTCSSNCRVKLNTR